MVVVELDKDTFGPDNHLVEWHRNGSGDDTDGFVVRTNRIARHVCTINLLQITRPGEDTVKCTIILTLNYHPSQYKLSSKLAKLLGIHTATRSDITSALWQYIKVLDHSPYYFRPSSLLMQTNRLQDPQEREFINNDKYFQQVKIYLVVQRCSQLLLLWVNTDI